MVTQDKKLLYNEKDLVHAVLYTLLIVAFIGVVACFVVNTGWKNEAVKKGHAGYYLDGDNERQWRWLQKGDRPIPAHWKQETD